MLSSRPLKRLLPVLLLHLIAFGIAIPILPVMVEDLGGTGTDVGLVLAVQATGQLIMSPLWGSLSDRFGRKPILIATIAGNAVFELATACATSLWMVYASRLLVGTCLANVTTASALISDVTDADERSGAMAIIGISFGVGFTLGPMIGAGVSLLPDAYPGWFSAGIGPLGVGLPFTAASLLAAISAVLGAVWLIEPDRSTQDRQQARAPLDVRAALEHLQSGPLLSMCILFFVYTVAIASLEATFVPYAQRVYGFEEFEVGLIFGAMGLLSAVVQGQVRLISPWLGDKNMTAGGVGLMAVGLGLAPLFEPLAWLLVLLGIATVGRAVVHPGALSMTADVGEEIGESGRVLGILQSSGSLGRILGPAIGGLAFDYVAIESPFWIAGALLAAVGAWWFATYSPPTLPAGSTPNQPH
jgi:MFS family permease